MPYYSSNVDRKIIEFAWDLSSVYEEREVNRIVFEAVLDILGGELVGKNTLDRISNQVVVEHWPRHALTLDLSVAVSQTISEHPAHVYYASQGSARPYKISDDYPTLASFGKTSLYADVLGPTALNTPHQMTMLVTPDSFSADDSEAVAIAVNREVSHDFTESDRDVAGRLQHAMVLAYARVKQVKREREKAGLTEKEIQLLALLRTGRSRKQAARQLGTSIRTVNKRTDDIFKKLEVGNITQCLYEIDKRGLLVRELPCRPDDLLE